MKEGFRQAMAWLHTWAGLIFGWLLFAIFLTGTLAYFKDEISHWMQPEIPARSVSSEASLTLAQDYLQQHAAGASRWLIELPSARQLDEPTRSTGGVLLKIVLRQGQTGFGGHRPGGNFRLHPVADLVFEVSQCAGQENRKQQPAEDQTGPGVQPGHGLTKALFHELPIQYASPETAASIRLGTIKPIQACHAVRQAKHQSTATR